jgi:hypothetical protein
MECLEHEVSPPAEQREKVDGPGGMTETKFFMVDFHSKVTGMQQTSQKTTQDRTEGAAVKRWREWAQYKGNG